MKKTFYAAFISLFIASFALTFTACSDKDDDPTPDTGDAAGSITDRSWSGPVEAAPEGEVLTFTFTASGGWTALTSNNWCVVSPARGRDGKSEIKVTVSPNDTNAERQTNVIVAVGKSTAAITITQKAKSNSTANFSEINKWIYDYMSENYLWNEPIPTLSLNGTASYETFFNSILTGIDALDHMNRDDGHWVNGKREGFYSYIERMQSGRSRAFDTTESGSGVMYMSWASLDEDGNEAVLLPLQVAPGSPAANIGLKRGDIITKIGGSKITGANVNSMVNKLYYGNTTVTVADPTYDSNGYLTNLTERAAVQLSSGSFEDPAIYESKVVTLTGGKKVGYLCYMYFDMDYDSQLIDIFKQFKSQNIDELIIDLRYNGGGHVLASTVLGSLIAGNTHRNEIYNHVTYNAARAAKGEEGDYKFGVDATPERTYTKISEAASTSLDLNRIFVLTTDMTASASELVINGLRGVDVTVNIIGTTTNGKNVGMEVARRTFGSYTYDLTPITFYSQNAKNFRDYSNGFTPDVEYDEGNSIPGEFGTTDDDLFAIAAMWIKNGTKPSISMSRAKAQNFRIIKVQPTEFRSPVKRRGAIALPEE